MLEQLRACPSLARISLETLAQEIVRLCGKGSRHFRKLIGASNVVQSYERVA
jgi:hypothetical protein